MLHTSSDHVVILLFLVTMVTLHLWVYAVDHLFVRAILPCLRGVVINNIENCNESMFVLNKLCLSKV